VGGGWPARGTRERSSLGEREAIAAARLGARPREGRGDLNRAWARPTVTAGDDVQDDTVLRRSSSGAHTVGPQWTSGSPCARRAYGTTTVEIEASPVRLRPGEGAWA
jgi:hypothetical protein